MSFNVFSFLCCFSRHLPVAGGGDGGHVEQLTGVILDAAEHHHSDGVALLLDDPQDVLRPQSLLALKNRILQNKNKTTF